MPAVIRRADALEVTRGPAELIGLDLGPEQAKKAFGKVASERPGAWLGPGQRVLDYNDL